MTKAEILQYVRYLINELSTDSGAMMEDTTNLIGFVEDAVEQVVLDLVDTYPNELLTYEDVSIVAGSKTCTLTKEFWQVLKIAKTVAGENETEMDIIDPLSQQYVETHDETSEKPYGAYVIGQTLYVYPTPSSSIANYIRVWGIRPEATTMPTGGPAYLPRITHRLIALWAAGLIAAMIGAKPDRFLAMYSNRLEKIKMMQKGKFQQAPRFVRESVVERTVRDSREKAFYDLDWS